MKYFLQTLVVFALVGLINPLAQGKDINAQYNLCVSKVKAHFGESTRVSLKQSKSRKGTTTLKLRIVPQESEPMLLACASEVATRGVVVLRDRNGEPVMS